LCFKDLIKGSSIDGILLRQWHCAERIFWLRICRANLFGSVINFFDGVGQLVDRTFAFNMHEIDLWMIEEEMVVKRSNIKTVVQRD
jgi:hypothetical protein